MTKLSISVAMCTYNGEKFLAEQLESIARQTRVPDELVICDDCSTDSTSTIIAEFSKSISFPVRFIRNAHNLGSTKNFEQAIALCQGDWIALCDQDDMWLPEKLARQAEVLQGDPAVGGVFSDAQLVDEMSRGLNGQLWATFKFNEDKQRMFRRGEAASALLSGSVVTGATLMFRRNFREIFEPIPTGWVHDGWIAWMIVLHSALALINEPLIRYRVHSNQQVGIGGMTPYSGLPLRERFAIARREEPPKYLSLAKELEQVKSRADLLGESKAKSIADIIQKKITFLNGRGSSYQDRWSHLRWILQNAQNYHRFDHGWKCWVRDSAMLFV